MGGRTPRRSDSRPAAGDSTARATAPGVSTNPVAPGDSPFTSARSSGTTTSAARLANMAKNPTPTAATYPRFRNSAGGTKGCDTWLMRQPKPAAARAMPRKLPQEEGAAKPAACPWVTPNRNRPAPRPSRTPPGRSKRRSSAVPPAGSTRLANGSSNSARANERRKRARQSRKCATAPPTTGPTDDPIPTLEATRPMAPPRRPGGSTLATATATVASAGMAAPPTPCTARPNTRAARVGAAAQTRLPTPNTTSPRAKTRRTPNRSETRPKSGTPTA
jgi:hypothetical protein